MANGASRDTFRVASTANSGSGGVRSGRSINTGTPALVETATSGWDPSSWIALRLSADLDRNSGGKCTSRPTAVPWPRSGVRTGAATPIKVTPSAATFVDGVEAGPPESTERSPGADEAMIRSFCESSLGRS